MFTTIINFFKYIAAQIASIGTNPKTWLFFAHSMTAYAILSFFHGSALLITAAIMTLIAGIKEFWFDYKYEKPVNTFAGKTSPTDFGEYMVGILLRLAVVYFGL